MIKFPAQGTIFHGRINVMGFRWFGQPRSLFRPLGESGRSLSSGPRIAVTFDAGQESLYAIDSGSWAASGGNPGACVTSSHTAAVTIALPAPATVTLMSASGKASNGFVDFKVTQADETETTLLHTAINPQGAWGEYSYDTPTEFDDVVSVQFVAGAAFQSGALDNCIVEYTET